MGGIDKKKIGKKIALKARSLPSLDVRNIKIPACWSEQSSAQNGKLPNASIIYGFGAGLLGAFSLYSFFTGVWLTGFLLLIPAVALVLFALHFIRHPF